ncbi:MAG TPA: hypothetical protein VK703_10525 [Candidatus Acidoferrales bacterium]|nr:hypothetical protein [Candidatus Acidoferrales bacterium]
MKLPKTPELCEKIPKKWPMASDVLLTGEPEALARLPIDHSVYAEHRNEPEMDVPSGLPPTCTLAFVVPRNVFGIDDTGKMETEEAGGTR